MLVDQSLTEFIFREAYLEPYRQIKPFNTYQLETWLKVRGIRLRWESIHHLWAIGILHPIAVNEAALLQTPGMSSSSRFVEVDIGNGPRIFIDLGHDVTDELVTPVPDGISSDVRNALWWHPFQVWEFGVLARILDFHVARDAVLRGSNTVARIAQLEM